MLLDGSKSSTSNNGSMYINVDLLSTCRLLPKTEMADNINLYKQYLKERNECNKYRLIFAINTVCSNVLFNRKTEIVKDEGSSGATAYTDSYDSSKGTQTYDAYNLVRNTSISHEEVSGNTITYHCGMDIFNNHMLRSKEFLFVNKITDVGNSSTANTIFDYNRDENGAIDKIMIEKGAATYNTNSHMYRTDNIMGFLECYKNKLAEKDGWFGFYNTTWLNSKNYKEKSINRVINNMSPCSFIDMYPNRTLYSFVPKYNQYRGRVEENWDYLLTYPYKNDYDKLKEINKNLLEKYTITSVTNDNLLSSIFIGNNITEGYTNSGTKIINFTPMFKHNLHVGRYINLYCYNKSEKTVYTENVQIVSVGDSEGFNKDTIFSVKLDDIQNIDLDKKENYIYFYKQTENGVECDYYFRKYKVLKYDGSIPKSSNSKLAFGRNIYGDNIAQLIYSDDIDISGLKDNLGRELSEMYLTIIKRNAGYKEWYEQGNYTASTIEYSHCFGKVSAGLDLPNEYTDYNVKYITNAEQLGYWWLTTGDTSKNYSLVASNYKKLDDNITKDNIINDGEILGNFVEFSNINFTETTLSNVYYRFNTAQRELGYYGRQWYGHIFVDELLYDDYDAVYGNKKFQVERKNLSREPKSRDENNKVQSYYDHVRGNIAPEGYYYNPNYKIQLKEISEDLSEAQTTLLNIDKKTTDTNYYTYNSLWKCGELVIKSPKKYKFERGKQICVYNKETKKTLFTTIHSVEKDGITVHAIYEPVNTNTGKTAIEEDSMILFVEDIVPPYAIYRQSSGTYIWRSPIKMSDILSGSSLYDAPFANGAIYIQNNINLFLKRQDPENQYGLARPEEKMNISIETLGDVSVWGKPKTDLRYLLVNDNNETNVC